MRPGVFWVKSESGCAHPTGLVPEDCDDVRGTDRADPLAGIRIVADRGDIWALMLTHVKQDFNAHSDWSGLRGI